MKQHLEIVKFLVQVFYGTANDCSNSREKSIILAPNNQGNTPLHIAAYHGQLKVTKFLVNVMENPDIPNNNGETPFQMAKRKGHDWNFLEKYCELLKLETAMANSMPYLEIDMKTRLDDEIQKLKQQRRRLVVKPVVTRKRLFKADASKGPNGPPSKMPAPDKN